METKEQKCFMTCQELTVSRELSWSQSPGPHWKSTALLLLLLKAARETDSQNKPRQDAAGTKILLPSKA